jgi:glucose-1-phosphate cytidylyltransferase
MPALNPAEIPVVILCGGQPVDLGHGDKRIKPLVTVNGKPLVAAVIAHYAHYGFTRFLLAAGHQAKELEAAVKALSLPKGVEAQVVDTGADSPTGTRLWKLKDQLKGAKVVAVTYSDTVSDVNLKELLDFHARHGQMASVVAAHLPTRFRILGLRGDEDQVRGFSEQPVISSAFINGGFYFFGQALFSAPYLGRAQEKMVLEEEILQELVKHEQLMAYRHDGRWQHYDNRRDLDFISSIAKVWS